MRRLYRWLGLAAAFAAVPGAWAQQGPHISFVYPAGGQQGTVLEVAVGGQQLAGATDAYVSGDGVRATVLRHASPLSSQSLGEATRRLGEVGRLHSRRLTATEDGEMAKAEALGLLMAKAADKFETSASKLGLEDPSPRRFAEFRRMIANPKRQPNAQIAETVTLRLTLAPNAQPGERELRLRTPSGCTNPLFFQVGQCREYLEKEPNDRTPDSGVLTTRVADLDFPDLESLPVTLNGQILPGDVDRFRFEAAKGTHLVAAVSARRLVPYLADAVPGWFQATLALLDAEGNELAFSDDFRFDPDPVLYYEIPEGGPYILEIRDAIYRGREDFVYRITVGELPFVTGIFPLGGRAGAKTTVQVEGWNLPADSLTLDAEDQGPGTLPVRVSRDGRVSNRVPFALDTLPECLEKESNNHRRRAQRVELPLIVNGRIDRPGDWDLFRFRGRAGDEIVAEVQARRLGSPLDSLLKLTDADGKHLAANDDHEDLGAGLTTHQADSELSIRLPADGTYVLHLGDTQHQGGPAYAYRLRISPRRPDFALRFAPSGIHAPPGSTVPITAYALRKDGFAEDIALSLNDMPKGFLLSGGWIPAGQDRMRLTLTVPPVPLEQPIKLRLQGRAVIDGKEVCRHAGPAEDMMQAFLYRHLVSTKDGMLTVSGYVQYGLPLKLIEKTPVKLPAGGTARVRLAPRTGLVAKQVRLGLNKPPKGIAIQELSPDPDGLAVVLRIDGASAKPGLKGNLILDAFEERPVTDKEGKPTGATWRAALGMLPAIPFEVVAGPPATDPAREPVRD